MSDPNWQSDSIAGKLAELAEECSEVIKCVCKIQRFGINSFHPLTQKRNVPDLIDEIKDARKAMDRVLECFGD